VKAFRLKGLWSVIKQTASEWMKKDPFRQSAIIAYYAIFSLPALLVIIISVAGLVFGREAVSGEISRQIGSMIGQSTAKDVEKIIAQAWASKDTVLATIIGVVTIIIGATGVFAQLQKSLNIIWDVEAKETKSTFWPLIKTRLFSFGLIISIGFLLLISLVISSLISVLSEWVKRHFPDAFLVLFEAVNFLISFGIISLLFAIMFKFLPDAKIKWRHVWLGSMFTAFLFTLGKTAIGLYFGKSDPGSVYGAAGSIVLLLLWVSYSSMILFFGAEFTRAYANYHEGDVKPAEVAKKAVRKPTE
jgi:membrane protein